MKEHIIINKDRTVVVPDSVRKIGIQYDHKVNTLTFDCPRYADDNQSIDMSRMAIYINFSRNDKTKGSIAATNVFVDPDDPEIMHFDVDITRSVTLVNGPIICLVCAKSTDAEGVEVNHWNSELFNKLSVGEGLEAEEELTEEEIDYITSLLQEINTTHAEVADIDTRVEDLEFNQEKQGVVSEVDLDAMTWTEGSYITGSGTIGSSSGYGISELVILPKMSTLILDATGYQSDVAMIAKSDHTPLVTSVDGKIHYEYYTDEEIQVYISCNTTEAKSAKIVRNVAETLSDLERENSELKGDLSDITTFGKNILQPIASAVSSGLTSVYDKSTDSFKITGTKDSGDHTRIIIGTLIPKQDGGYTCSIIDNSGNGKSAIYIYNGDTKIVTIGATSFKNYFELEKGVTYTFEVYVAPKTVVDYNISIMIAYGTDTDFEPYALYVPVEKIANIDLSDKYLSILGVSIDTYSGWIPDGNVAYYSDNNLESVNNTWWKKLIDATGINLVLNNSYTGACATTNGKDYASSGVARCTNLTDGLHTPNVIFIGSFAANDWMYSECGSWDMSMSDLLAGVNVDLSVSENYEQYKSVTETYAGAMATIFYRIQEQFPDARIFALDMYNYTRSNGKNPPRRSVTNKTYTIAQYNKALYDVADYFGVRVVPVSKCGINAKNSVSYTVEGEEAVSNLHPNIDGQDMIYHSVYETMKNAFD